MTATPYSRRDVRRLSLSLLSACLASAPFSALLAQGTPVTSPSEYVKATWYSLFRLDPEGALSGAPRICIDSHGLTIGDSDPRDLTTLAEPDTATVPFLEGIGQYVVDAADCWSVVSDTAYPTLYVQGSITRHASGRGDSVSVALFQLFQARPCITTVTPRCARPAKGAATIYVTGMVARTPAGWPPITLRQTHPDF